MTARTRFVPGFGIVVDRHSPDERTRFLPGYGVVAGEATTAAASTTETFFLPGYGIAVDAEDGDEYFLPGYGVVANNEAAPAPSAEDILQHIFDVRFDA